MTLALDPVTSIQQQVWAAGDYPAIGAKLVFVAEALFEEAEVGAGSRVLDVATGSGNAALAAARAGCRVTALDFVPELLDRAAARAAAERLHLDLVEGDAADLPFEDGAFDAVFSVFGHMFAPEQERTASELARVCRAGGTIALATWTPDGVAADFFAVIGKYAPPPPPESPSPLAWGTEDGVRALLGPHVAELHVTTRTFRMRYPSAAEMADLYLRTFGPVVAVAALLDDAGRAALSADLVDLGRRWTTRDDDAVSLPATYVEVIATR